MGGIRILGRRWDISSDDFVFPCTSEAIARFLWWIIVLIAYSVQAGATCHPASDLYHLHAYIIVCLTMNAIDIVLGAAIAWLSSRGTVNNERPRRNVVYLLYIRVPLGAFEFIWLILGTYWSFSVGEFLPWKMQCMEPVLITARVTVVLGWIMFVYACVGVFLIFDALGNLSSEHHYTAVRARSRNLWRTRLKCICCVCLGRDDNATMAFEDVAGLFSSYFSVYQMTTSDIWAGLILVANDIQPLQETASIRSNNLQLESSLKGPPDWMTLGNALRFMQFAAGAYGHLNYLGARCSWNPCKVARTLLDLYRGSRCCSCNTGDATVKGDCFLCNTAAFKLETGLKSADLFYVSFSNKIYETPFITAIDHATKSVVVVIRGSLSLSDAMTDLSVSGVAIKMSTEQVYVHKGISKSAEYVFQKLENEKILYDLFILYPDYQLVVTGHSLGAGVAAVLALGLHDKYPSVRCFAFSPPGCVVSRNNSKTHTEDIICSVVLGDDFIPRLSMLTAERLKGDVLQALEHCDRPKYDILVRGCFRLLCVPRGRAPEAIVAAEAGEIPAAAIVDSVVGNQQQASTIGEGQYNNSRLPLIRSPTSSSNNGDSPAGEANYRSIGSNPAGSPVLSQPRSGSPMIDQGEENPEVSLYLPGRVIYIKRQPGQVFRGVWTDFSKFGNIKLSKNMLADHLPHSVLGALNEIQFQNMNL